MSEQDYEDEAPKLNLSISFDRKSGLYVARLENGARFNFSPANVSGKLGANLDLLKDYTNRNAKGEAPRPHVTVATGDEALIEQAIAAGKLQRVGVTADVVLMEF